MTENVTKASSTLTEPQSMITVRMPRSLHNRLKDAAKRHNTSLNKLCLELLEFGRVVSTRVESEESGEDEESDVRPVPE